MKKNIYEKVKLQIEFTTRNELNFLTEIKI